LENLLIMKHRSLQRVLYLFFGILLFLSGLFIGNKGLSPALFFDFRDSKRQTSESAFEPVLETWELIHEEYFDQPLDDELLAEGAIEGMLATLDDRNTIYLTPDEEESARNALEGNIEGIGAEVTSIDGDIVIVSPYEGSPADLAGLQQGDILLSANGVSLTGLDVFEAASYVRGPAGTSVNLLIKRDESQFYLDIERGVISISSVRGELIDDRFAYVRLSRFDTNTGEDLEELLEKLTAMDPRGLIIDLRSNPGGSLSSVVNVADQFLPEGVILQEKFGNGKEKVFESNDGESAEALPLAVLINEGSASASEVLAGAISDHQRGVLIGDVSFGKGTVQSWKTLSNGGGLRITVARWLTPSGAWVHGEGLQPDIEIPLSESNESRSEDAQLQAAIEYLNDQLSSGQQVEINP
jgi:carboxyl-terminal processing protease